MDRTEFMASIMHDSMSKQQTIEWQNSALQTAIDLVERMKVVQGMTERHNRLLTNALDTIATEIGREAGFRQLSETEQRVLTIIFDVSSQLLGDIRKA